MNLALARMSAGRERERGTTENLWSNTSTSRCACVAFHRPHFVRLSFCVLSNSGKKEFTLPLCVCVCAILFIPHRLLLQSADNNKKKPEIESEELGIEEKYDEKKRL